MGRFGLNEYTYQPSNFQVNRTVGVLLMFTGNAEEKLSKSFSIHFKYTFSCEMAVYSVTMANKHIPPEKYTSQPNNNPFDSCDDEN